RAEGRRRVPNHISRYAAGLIHSLSDRHEDGGPFGEHFHLRWSRLFFSHKDLDSQPPADPSLAFFPSDGDPFHVGPCLQLFVVSNHRLVPSHFGRFLPCRLLGSPALCGRFFRRDRGWLRDGAFHHTGLSTVAGRSRSVPLCLLAVLSHGLKIGANTLAKKSVLNTRPADKPFSRFCWS